MCSLFKKIIINESTAFYISDEGPSNRTWSSMWKIIYGL